MSIHMIMKQQIQDFEKWKAFFDSHGQEQEKYGLTLLDLLQNTENNNELTVHFEVASEEKARELLRSPLFLHAIEQAGVIGTPEVHFYHEA